VSKSPIGDIADCCKIKAIYGAVLARQHTWRKPPSLPDSGLLFDKNPQPMWIYDIKTLAFLAVNQSAIAMYGYSREEFLGMTLRDICNSQDNARLEKELLYPGPAMPYFAEWQHYAKNRTKLNVQIRARKMNWRGRQAAMIIARDISQDHKTRDEAFLIWQQHLQLQEIISQSPAIALMWDPLPSLPVTYVSDNVALLGYRPEQFMKEGLCYSQIIHPEDLQYVIDEINSYIHRNISHFVQEYRILTVERQVCWVEVRTWVNRDSTEQVLGYSGVALDISERRRAEKRLYYQAALLKNVSDAIISTDLAFNILSWNPAAEQVFQWKELEILGKHWYSLTEVQYLGQNASDVQRQVNSLGYWAGLISQKRKDGQTITLDARISMVKDTGGEPFGIVIACRDISEKIKIEQSLDKSEKQYRAIFEQAAVGVSRTDVNGLFLDVNEKFCQITGYSRQELLGLSYKDITDPDDLQANLTIRQELQAKKKNYANLEKRYIRKDGSRTWVNLTLSYIESGPETEPFLLAITEDINLRKSQERELQALYEAGLALSYLKTPEEISQHIIEILNNYLDWHHAGVWMREKSTDNIRILAYSTPASPDEAEAERQKSQEMVHSMDNGLTGWAMRQARTIRRGNVFTDSHYLGVNKQIKSGMYVPLMSKGQVIGCLMVESEEFNDFSEYDQRLLETLASQATIAFENANLLAAAQNRANQMQAVIQASQAISGNLDLPSLLDAIFKSTQAAIPAVERGTILLGNDDGLLHVRGSLGYADPELLNAVIPDTIGYGAQAYREQKGILVTNIQGLPDQKHFEHFSETKDIQSAIAAPLIVKGKSIGVICLDNFVHPSAFTEADLQLLTTFAASAAISIENARLFEQTQSRLAHILALRQIDNTINASADILVIMNVILDKALEQLNADAACILTFNSGTMNLEHQASLGFRRENIQKTHFRIGEDLPARALLDHKTVIITDLSTVIQRSERKYLVEKEDFVAYGCAPMLAKGEVKGLIEVFGRKPFKINPEWISFVEMLGSQAAIAIENAQLYQDLQRSNLELMIAYDATIEGWAQALEYRDQETEGHSRRVLELTLQLARKMGISGHELMHIRRGALLHDIGKMSIPDSILHKPGPLSDEEWILMRKHPIRAYELMSKIPYLQYALEIPYCHHEKWDGTGYPRGLKNEQIPLAARIFAVVDVFDALTSDRPYRPALSEPEVFQYIREQSGHHFDPAVVRTFLTLMNQPTDEPPADN
jgi:PAS domain S-box-containing protein/putative nucleotidyltransferase with HDIG domain